jgi:ribosome-associated heat shock protein Hsp15
MPANRILKRVLGLHLPARKYIIRGCLLLLRIAIFSAVNESLRIDKWLWSVRLFKTRTEAAEACKGGKVKLNGDAVKPAKELKENDTVSFRSGTISRTFRVAGFPKSRVSAKLVADYCEDLTPPEEYERQKSEKQYERPFFYTGKGRPTKRDRRKLDGMQ